MHGQRLANYPAINQPPGFTHLGIETMGETHHQTQTRLLTHGQHAVSLLDTARDGFLHHQMCASLSSRFRRRQVQGGGQADA